MRGWGWVVLMLAMVWGQTPAAAAPVTTKSQALMRVRAFMQQAGWKIYRGHSSTTIAPMPFHPQEWFISFAPSRKKSQVALAFSIDAESGCVRSAVNHAAMRAAVADPVDEAVFSRERALVLAEECLRWADVTLAEYRLVRNAPWSAPGTPGITHWFVEYRRSYHGSFFTHDRAVIVLNPRNGALLSLSYSDASPLPASVEPRLTAVQVSKIAADYLASLPIQAAVSSPQLLITVRLHPVTGQPAAYLCWQISAEHAEGVLPFSITIDDESGALCTAASLPSPLTP